MKKISILDPVIAFFMLVIIFSASRIFAETTSTINGVGYADYYYNFQNHDPAEESRNAFQFRRIYFTFENTVRPEMKVRFRLESQHAGYGSETRLTPFVKHAYLEWNGLIPNHKVIFGIQETNAFNNAEAIWGYRSIEKTIMDLNKLSPSADMGIGLKGDLGKSVHHWLTVMNGTGYGSSEVDRFKKIGYALWFTPVNGLILEGYADYEPQNPNDPQTENAPSGTKDYFPGKGYYTLKAFAGYKNSSLSVGAEFISRTNKQTGLSNPVITTDELVDFQKSDVTKTGYSLFGSIFTPIQKLKVFARYDYFDSNTSDHVFTNFSNGKLTSGKDDQASLFIAGLDYIQQSNLHIMPNIMIKSYSESNKKSDIVARITMYFIYDSGKIVTN